MACYTDLQMAAALRVAGVDAGNAAYLVATAHPESSGCDVVQQGQPYSTTGWGVWQITPGNSESQVGSNNALLNLMANARAAAAKLASGGLSQWTTITSGKYVPFFGAAKQAVATVYNMSEAEVSKLAHSAGTGKAQTTGFSLTNPLGSLGSDIFGNLFNDMAQSFGLPSPQDLFKRLGLILFGGALVLVGLVMLVGRGAASTAITLAAPETRAAETVSGATRRARETATERSARRREAEASHEREERRMDRELAQRASE